VIDLPPKLSLCILTWNVNTQRISDPYRLRKLLEKGVDLIVVGLQEIVDLNAKSMLKNHDNLEDQWESVILQALTFGDLKYCKLSSIRLFGILLFIFVKLEVHSYVEDVMSNKIGTGVLGLGGNKGAVAIRFNVFDRNVVFVCSHLAAHQGNVTDRNADFHKIMSKLTFSETGNNVYKSETPRDSGGSGNGKNITIDSHDVIFWFGDLNYRLDFKDTEVPKVIELIQKKKWNSLVKRDQLFLQIREKKAFVGFKENQIRFQPTFKFVPDSNEYDKVKKRIPSYCDRVLWKVNGKKTQKKIVFDCLGYAALTDQTMSDHKPVVAVFELKMK